MKGLVLNQLQVTSHGFCLDGPTTFQMVNMQKSYHRSFESFPFKTSGLLLLSTSSRCWACTRFGGYERLGIESVTSHGFCSDGPTTFQWLACRRVITYHRSFESFPYKIFRLTASFHIFQMLSLHSIWRIWKAWYWISYKLQVMDFVQMDPQLFNG